MAKHPSKPTETTSNAPATETTSNAPATDNTTQTSPPAANVAQNSPDQNKATDSAPATDPAPATTVAASDNTNAVNTNVSNVVTVSFGGAVSGKVTKPSGTPFREFTAGVGVVSDFESYKFTGNDKGQKIKEDFPITSNMDITSTKKSRLG
jgi:hypothetical protein